MGRAAAARPCSDDSVLRTPGVLLLIWPLNRLNRGWPAWSSRAVAYVIGGLAAFWVFQRTLTAVWPLG